MDYVLGARVQKKTTAEAAGSIGAQAGSIGAQAGTSRPVRFISTEEHFAAPEWRSRTLALWHSEMP